MSTQEIVRELAKSSRDELTEVDLRLHELLQEKIRPGGKSWGDTGKTFEKVCNGVTGLKMVKQTLNRYPGPRKDRLASENFRVPLNYFLHGNVIAPAATLCEPKLLPSMEATIWQRVRDSNPCITKTLPPNVTESRRSALALDLYI